MMKSTWLLAGMLMVIPPAWADWKLAAETARAHWYLDYSTISTKGDLRQAWALKDRALPDVDGSLSAKFMLEYDCQNARSRFLQWIAYPAQMGEGAVLSSDDVAGNWLHATPDTVREALQQAVCSQP